MKEMFISCLFLLTLFNHTQKKRELEKLEFFRKFGKPLEFFRMTLEFLWNFFFGH